MNIKSRKFLVWLAWYALLIASFIVTKTVNDTLIGWFGAVSIIYIGGNVAQKFTIAKLGI